MILENPASHYIDLLRDIQHHPRMVSASSQKDNPDIVANLNVLFVYTVILSISDLPAFSSFEGAALYLRMQLFYFKIESDFVYFLFIKTKLELLFTPRPVTHAQKLQNSGFAQVTLGFVTQKTRENASRWRGCEK